MKLQRALLVFSIFLSTGNLFAMSGYFCNMTDLNKYAFEGKISSDVCRAARNTYYECTDHYQNNTSSNWLCDMAVQKIECIDLTQTGKAVDVSSCKL